MISCLVFSKTRTSTVTYDSVHILLTFGSSYRSRHPYPALGLYRKKHCNFFSRGVISGPGIYRIMFDTESGPIDEAEKSQRKELKSDARRSAPVERKKRNLAARFCIAVWVKKDRLNNTFGVSRKSPHENGRMLVDRLDGIIGSG